MAKPTLVGFRLILMLALAGCGVDYDDIAALRQAYASKNPGNIRVVAIADPGAETYINGIRLAEKHLNERPQKVFGRRLEVVVKPGGTEFDAAQGSILSVAEDPRVLAVLGHQYSNVAIPASVIYEASQLVFLPPFATAQGLTTHNFQFTFRMAPNNEDMAKQTASVAEMLGYKKAVLLYAQDDYNRELAFLFEDAAIDRGMVFVHRHSVSGQETDYRDLITEFANKPIDMVFLATGAEAGARIVRQLREMGVPVPVMGSDALAKRTFVETVGSLGDNTITPMIYHAEAETFINRRFREDYRNEFGEEPDQDAAQGYDSLGLMAAGIEQAHSTLPSLVASTLHYLSFWTGVTGVHAFDSRGEILGKKYFFQVLRDGKWVFLPAVHLPFFLAEFDRSTRARLGSEAEVASFGKRFAENLPLDDLRVVQLDFLYEILQFRRLGVIYGEETPGQAPGNLARIARLGEKRGFEVQTCGIVFSDSDKSRVESQLLDCYGKLSIGVDAINITALHGIDKDTVVRLQEPLREYRIPVLALQGDTAFDEGMAIKIGRLGDQLNLQSDYYLDLFSEILNGIKMYEFAGKLNNLPVMAVNLKALDDYGLLRSGSLVGLAPDLYLEWMVAKQ